MKMKRKNNRALGIVACGLAMLVANVANGALRTESSAARSGAGVRADFTKVIPLPDSICQEAGVKPFTITRSTTITYPAGDAELADEARLLSEYIAEQTGIVARVSDRAPSRDFIRLRNSGCGRGESYVLTSCRDSIVIDGADASGVFYGIQTLRKAVPAEKSKRVDVPAVKITDGPRFAYRGALLDVARHFFPTDSLKKFIDLLALHNINNMHLHLTDDHGWRMEVPKRPRLTEIGSRRRCSIIGHSASDFDTIPVEGYYTRQELKDLVRYAAERRINIIPEIDIPGHIMSALAAYPELGCTGGPYEVKCRWDGAVGVLCAGNDSIYPFLRDVFDEVMEVFPSKLIHIGGDEVQKADWKNCPRCQDFAARHGLDTDSLSTREEKLQNYVMKHVVDYLGQHGRRVIGWDEVLDADFAKDAVIMSWRGEQGGVAGARKGHQVVMTPAVYMYFNFYQSTDIENEPIAIGGYIPVDMVYGYDPVPAGLTADEQSRIMGPQANLWTEYIKDFPTVQYMELPRMAALCEVQWCRPEKKNYREFVGRLPRLLSLYDRGGYRYSDHVFDVSGKILAAPDERVVKVVLSTDDDAPVHYTLDGTDPDQSSALYTDTLRISTPVVLKASAIRDGKAGRVYNGAIAFSKATFKPITLSVQPHPRYTFDGPSMLVDGRLGSNGFTDGLWLGFPYPSLDFTIDLEERQSVESLGFHNLVTTDSWIFPPRRVVVSVSDDGETFTDVYAQDFPAISGNDSSIHPLSFTFTPTDARFIRLHVDTETSMPTWHAGAGRQSFFFIDEIEVK
jgi:hexosaminidase